MIRKALALLLQSVSQRRKGKLYILSLKGHLVQRSWLSSEFSELDFYNLGLADLAEKCNLSQPKTLAVVRHLKLQGP